MNPTMYIFLNKGLGMSTGKSAAQAGHAAVEAYRLSGGTPQSAEVTKAWRSGGHYKKIVFEAESAVQLMVVDRYISDRGFKTALIIDEGRTEIEPFTPTALGIEIVDKDDAHVADTFGGFRLYKDPKPKSNPYPKWDPKHYAWKRSR